MSPPEELYEDLLARWSVQSYPPVAAWHPEREGEIDIRIDAEGVWHHEGDPIARQELVRLFSRILRRDEDGFHLVTPAEKLRITVDDAPFLATELAVGRREAGAELLFTTSVGDLVLADALHPVWVEARSDGQPVPYLHVRDGLNARISRPVYYRLAELCEADGDGYWLESRGTRFRLG